MRALASLTYTKQEKKLPSKHAKRAAEPRQMQCFQTVRTLRGPASAAHYSQFAALMDEYAAVYSC